MSDQEQITPRNPPSTVMTRTSVLFEVLLHHYQKSYYASPEVLSQIIVERILGTVKKVRNHHARVITAEGGFHGEWDDESFRLTIF